MIDAGVVGTADAAQSSDAPADARASTTTPRRPASGGSTSAAAGTTSTTASAAPATGGGGATLYARACGRCHPNGNEDIGPRLRGIGWTEARMRQQVRQGGGRMRPIPASRLSDADLTTVIAYMRTMNAVR